MDSPVGTQFPQPKVTYRDRQVLLDDAIGPQWAVLVWGNDPGQVLPPSAVKSLKELGAQMVAIVPQTQREWAEREMSESTLVLGDHTGALKRWFDDRPTPVVFLRPDRFVAAASLIQEAPQTLTALLKAISYRTPGVATSSADSGARFRQDGADTRRGALASGIA